MSEFAEVPGPGAVLVDLNGRGMLYTTSVWLDEAGHVSDGGCGQSGTGWALCDGSVVVTGQVGPDVVAIEVEVVSEIGDRHFSFEVTPLTNGWYAGCRPLPRDWDGMDGLQLRVHERT